MINDKQVLKLSKNYQETGSISMSSLKSGMSRNSASKYLKSGKLPSELKKPRKGRTRTNPFESIHEEIKKMISENPKLEATSLLPYLQEKYPDQYSDGMLRSLQRRFKEIRQELNSEREVFFEQDHRPGKKMQLDWTWCNQLNVTIQGKDFKHKLCHCVLTYSNWEWATICLSESYLSLAQGFQSAIRKLGKIPEILQTDNSSAATHQISNDKLTRAFNQRYLEFTEHHGVKPQTSNVAKPNENGCVETLNGHLKNRLEQALILRGNRDFNTQADYQTFLESVLNKANTPREGKLQEEIALMQSAAPICLPEYNEEYSRVSKGSLVSLNRTIYSVPSTYIGMDLRFRCFEQYIEAYHGQKHLFKMDREVNRKASINYRHVIHSLRCKPGAFDAYRYREFMFPGFIFRQTYDRLLILYGNRLADREYLEILYLASKEGEARVSASLQDLFSDIDLKLSFFELKKLMGLTSQIQELSLHPELKSYDSLMGGSDVQS